MPVTSKHRPTAVIAEDEPLLAAALEYELCKAWPELEILAVATDGNAAVELALQHRPDMLFFDIRMPGRSGLEAAEELAEHWLETRFPLLVFVTAYDKYAVEAFEAQAIDYVMKPVNSERIAKTVDRLKKALHDQSNDPLDADHTLDQLRRLLKASAASSDAPFPSSTKLSVIQASLGNSIRMIPVDEIVYFEAADKYVRVLTSDHEYLLRTPLKELVPQLDGEKFWQVHRGLVVRVASIDQAHRDDTGKVTLTLKARPEKLAVSRLYAGRFKAM